MIPNTVIYDSREEEKTEKYNYIQKNTEIFSKVQKKKQTTKKNLPTLNPPRW